MRSRVRGVPRRRARKTRSSHRFQNRRVFDGIFGRIKSRKKKCRARAFRYTTGIGYGLTEQQGRVLYDFLQQAALLRSHWSRSATMAPVMISMNAVSATLLASGGDVASLAPELVNDNPLRVGLGARAHGPAAIRAAHAIKRCLFALTHLELVALVILSLLQGQLRDGPLVEEGPQRLRGHINVASEVARARSHLRHKHSREAFKRIQKLRRRLAVP